MLRVTLPAERGQIASTHCMRRSLSSTADWQEATMIDRKYRRIALAPDPPVDSWKWEQAYRGYLAIMRRAKHWAKMPAIDIEQFKGGDHA